MQKSNSALAAISKGRISPDLHHITEVATTWKMKNEQLHENKAMLAHYN